MLAIKKATGQDALSACLPPWRKNSSRPVTLYAMLDFAANQFVEISHRFGLLIGQYRRGDPDPTVLRDSLNDMIKHCGQLGLRATSGHLTNLLLEIFQTYPDCVDKTEIESSGLFNVRVDLNPYDLVRHIELIYSTMKIELGSLMFKLVPPERSHFYAPDWIGRTVQEKFPTSHRELLWAGECYSLGQGTASVFHSMRALEPSLSALAAHFSIDASHRNWQPVIGEIEDRIRELGKQAKSLPKIEDEKFFGGAARHLYFVKNALRNHVNHTRDVYGDDEALRIMQSTLHFIESLCPRLSE